MKTDKCKKRKKKFTCNHYNRPRFYIDREEGKIFYRNVLFASTTFSSIGAFIRPAEEMVRLANAMDVLEYEKGLDPMYKG